MTQCAHRPLLWLIMILTVAGGLATRPPAGAKSPSGSFVRHAFPLPGGHVQYSSPTLADLDGDGISEVVLGTTACRDDPCIPDQTTAVIAMRGNGQLLWSRDVQAPVNATPAIGDVDGDGRLEIIVGLGGDVDDTDQDGGVVALGQDGDELWRFTTTDNNGDGYADGVFSSPSLCDVDGDGDLEIAFGSWDTRIYLLDHLGNALWHDLPPNASGPGYLNGDTIWSSPACVDFNDDGRQEIVIGADITGGGILPDGTHTQDGGFLYILDGQGQTLVRRYLPEVIYSSPAVADINGDGRADIVVGTGWYWWGAHGQSAQPKVYAFNTDLIFSGLPYDDPGKLPSLSGWPTQTQFPGFSSPALADLDGNGRHDVIIGTSHPFLDNGPILGDGHLHAWRGDGAPVAGWPAEPQNAAGFDGPIFASPTAADVDGDGASELLVTMIWDIFVYESDGVLQERLETEWTTWSAPAVGDANGNGRLEIWVGGSKMDDDGRGYLWRFEHTSAGLGQRPWPMFRGSAAHLGQPFQPPRLDAMPGELVAYHEFGAGGKAVTTLTLSNPGDVAYQWQVSGAPSDVTVVPANDVVPARQSRTLQVVVAAQGQPLGSHPLGNVTIVGSAPGGALAGSPLTTPLTLVVVEQMERAYLPLVIRP